MNDPPIWFKSEKEIWSIREKVWLKRLLERKTCEYCPNDAIKTRAYGVRLLEDDLCVLLACKGCARKYYEVCAIESEKDM